jgi:hypothetical protein
MVKKKMRLALILASNLYMSPYVRYYTEILDKCGVPYDIIAWNRFGVAEAGVQAFNLKSSLHKSVLGKLIDYFRYRCFVKSKLTEGNYDKVVVFTIVNALMLFPFLKKRYKHRFIVDIRDYVAAAKYVPSRLSAAIQNAALVVISSAGYKQWLPKDNAYLIRHNTQIFRTVESRVRIEGQSKYKILTIGAIGYYDANRRLIESLADSPMFELEFVGSGYAEQSLKDFAASRGIKNVCFLGRYAKEDEPKYLRDAALISILIDDSINSITCMSNRFYLSLVYGIPMMVDSNTEQARWVEKYNLGVIIDKNQNIKQQIVQYLQMFDSQAFNAGRKACLQIVQRDIVEFESKFKTFLGISSLPLANP